jgi:hypothetical protein
MHHERHIQNDGRHGRLDADLRCLRSRDRVDVRASRLRGHPLCRDHDRMNTFRTDYRTFRLDRLDNDKRDRQRQRTDSRRMARARKVAAYVWGDALGLS